MEHAINVLVEYAAEIGVAVACLCIVGAFICAIVVFVKNARNARKES